MYFYSFTIPNPFIPKLCIDSLPLPLIGRKPPNWQDPVQTPSPTDYLAPKPTPSPNPNRHQYDLKTTNSNPSFLTSFHHPHHFIPPTCASLQWHHNNCNPHQSLHHCASEVPLTRTSPNNERLSFISSDLSDDSISLGVFCRWWTHWCLINIIPASRVGIWWLLQFNIWLTMLAMMTVISVIAIESVAGLLGWDLSICSVHGRRRSIVVRCRLVVLTIWRWLGHPACTIHWLDALTTTTTGVDASGDIC